MVVVALVVVVDEAVDVVVELVVVLDVAVAVVVLGVNVDATKQTCGSRCQHWLHCITHSNDSL